MKQMKFFAMVIAAVAIFASCTNEDVSKSEIAVPAKVSLNIVGNGNGRASSEFNPDNADNTISEVTVFFVRANGSFDRMPLAVSVPFATQLNDIVVTSLLDKVYVVANANSALTGITDLATLQSKLVDIDNAGVSSQVAPILTANGIGTGGKIYQVGSATPTTYDTAGNGAGNLTTVVMGFVPARIRVTVVNNMTNPANIILDDISIINAPTQSYLFRALGTLDMDPKTYVWGMADNGFVNFPAGTDVKTYYNEAYSTTSTPFFYVFPNKSVSYVPIALATVHATTVVLKGTFKGAPIYFPVRFDGVDVTEHIESGKAYNLSITLNGDASTGGGGTTDPTVPVTKSHVQITVTPAAWVSAGITKEFS